MTNNTKRDRKQESSTARKDDWKLTETQAQILSLYIRDGDLHGDENAIGDFLLLLRAFTYADDSLERETLYIAIENIFAPFCISATRAIDRLCRQNLHELRRRADGKVSVTG